MITYFPFDSTTDAGDEKKIYEPSQKPLLKSKYLLVVLHKTIVNVYFDLLILNSSRFWFLNEINLEIGLMRNYEMQH